MGNWVIGALALFTTAAHAIELATSAQALTTSDVILSTSSSTAPVLLLPPPLPNGLPGPRILPPPPEPLFISAPVKEEPQRFTFPPTQSCEETFRYKVGWDLSETFCIDATAAVVAGRIERLFDGGTTSTTDGKYKPGAHENRVCFATLVHSTTKEKVYLALTFGFGGLNDNYSGPGFSGHGEKNRVEIKPENFWSTIAVHCATQKIMEDAIRTGKVKYNLLGNSYPARLGANLVSACKFDFSNINQDQFNCRTYTDTAKVPDGGFPPTEPAAPKVRDVPVCCMCALKEGVPVNTSSLANMNATGFLTDFVVPDSAQTNAQIITYCVERCRMPGSIGVAFCPTK